MSKCFACYIALNAEDHIARSMRSLVAVVDGFVVIVDDATTDGTEDAIASVDLAPEQRLIVARRPWNHSFSDARNAAIVAARNCGADWILSMDADEELDPKSIGLFRQVRKRDDVDLWTMPLLIDPSYGAPAYQHPEFGKCGINFRNRMFRANRFGFRFRVHEQLCNIDDRDDWIEDIEGVRFFHYGRMTWAKDDYYTALMVLDHKDMPDEPIPATMLAEAACAADDTARAAQYLDGVDQERVKSGPIAAKYWTVKGKMNQKAWIQAAIANLPRFQAFRARDEALACYMKAYKLNPSEPDAAIHAATVMWTGYKDKSEDAVRLLVDVLNADPSCIVAAHMLLLYRDHGEGPTGDREAFLRRLGEYLQANANEQTDARLEAEGRTPGSAEVANLERLDDIVAAGETVAPGADVQGNFEMGDRKHG